MIMPETQALRAVDRSWRVVVAASTPGELEELRLALEPLGRGRHGPFAWTRGAVGDAQVWLLCSGVGKTNAAMAAAAALGTIAPRLLLGVGVGGAYPGAGLSVGDLAVATEEWYGDDGADTGEGWLGLEALGLPAWEAPGGERYFNRFPADPGLGAALARASSRVAAVRAGAFVTVSTVTGTAARARVLEERFGGVCESMEGAALAHAAAAFGVPFAEVRGISNAVGPRDRASWRLAEAAEASQEAALAFLRGLAAEGVGP